MSEKIERALRNCFYPKEGKPGLRKVPVNLIRAKEHIDKANHNLRAMKAVFDNQLFDWTIICGYYAMYHGVLASLFKIGIRATAHYCAIAAFKKFYVERDKAESKYINYINKAKQLEQKYAETLDKAQEDRVIEQYGVEILSHDEAEWILESAKNFVLKIEEVLAE